MHKMEHHYKDMQDMEFTVQDGQLYLLQTRNGKRTAAAALKVVSDMVDEGIITKEEALQRIEPEQLDHLLHPAIDPNHGRTPVTKGLPASPGAAVGEIVFDADLPPNAAARVSRSSWCATRPPPTTSTASSSPRAFSPPTAA